MLPPEGAKFTILLVGGGPCEAALKEQARRLRIDDFVRFVGRVPQDKIQRYYGLVDIFVYPRHAMRPTERVTPLKPLEAMARGGIVLASNVGGHRELIRNRETRVLTADDVTDLVSSISGLARNREAWPRIAQTARQFVERERNWKVTTAGYSDAYSYALASARQHIRKNRERSDRNSSA